MVNRMRTDLVNILACPVCKQHPLILSVVREDAEGVVEGKLHCPRCKVDYPIIERIPNLMPPTTSEQPSTP